MSFQLPGVETSIETNNGASKEPYPRAIPLPPSDLASAPSLHPFRSRFAHRQSGPVPQSAAVPCPFFLTRLIRKPYCSLHDF